MSGIFLLITAATLRILANPFANVFQKKLTRKGHHPLVVNFLTYFALSLFCLPFAFTGIWNRLTPDFWIFSILGGVAGATGNGFLVKALEKGDLSVLGPINAYKSVVGLLVGLILLNEVPTLWGIAGTALIIWGSYFVLNTTEDRFTWKLLGKKEIQYRIWALVLTAVEAVLIKKVILASTVNMAFLSWCWFGALFSFFLLLLSKIKLNESFKESRTEDLGQYLFLVLCIGAMQLTTNYVLGHMPVGFALALFQLSTIVSVFLGYHIFQEKDLLKKLIGSAIMLGGSVLIILSKTQ